MKKTVFISIPIIIVIIIGIIGITRQHSKNTLTSSEQGGQVATSSQTKGVNENSVDGIVASFVTDGDADASLASSESQDETFITTEVDGYTNLGSSYENNI